MAERSTAYWFEYCIFGNVLVNQADAAALDARRGLQCCTCVLGLMTDTTNLSVAERGDKAIANWKALVDPLKAAEMIGGLKLLSRGVDASQHQLLGLLCRELDDENGGGSIWSAGHPEQISQNFGIPQDILQYLVAVHIKNVAIQSEFIKVAPITGRVSLR